MTSSPYRPMRLPAAADLDAVTAAHQAHRNARKLPCPQCRVGAGRPCRGTEGALAQGYSHVARRRALEAAVPP